MRFDQKDAQHGDGGDEQEIAAVTRSKDRPRHVDAVVAAGADLAQKSGPPTGKLMTVTRVWNAPASISVTSAR
jgi:hypothetical protein